MADVEATPAFRKVLRKKPPEMQRAVKECIARLVADPAHPGLRVHRVQGTPGVWEAYVDQGNRITGPTASLDTRCPADKTLTKCTFAVRERER
jgi:hypothetical protein